MSLFEEILQDLNAAIAANDNDRVDELRERYLEVAPSSNETSDIRYRHGLSKLFRHQDVSAAMVLFKEAAANKSAPIAPEARISYALCLRTQRKFTQAIFELKKLLPTGVAPSMHTAQALDFLGVIMRESTTTKPADIEKNDLLRVEHLQSLVDDATAVDDRAQWLLRLAAAYADCGTGGDIGRARQTLQKVIKLGKSAGPALKSARAQLKLLPR